MSESSRKSFRLDRLFTWLFHAPPPADTHRPHLCTLQRLRHDEQNMSLQPPSARLASAAQSHCCVASPRAACHDLRIPRCAAGRGHLQALGNRHTRRAALLDERRRVHQAEG